MKKYLRFLATMVFAFFTAFTFNSCSSDDDLNEDSPNSDVEEAIGFSPTVNGKYLTSVGDFDFIYNDYTGILERYISWDDTYNVSHDPFEVICSEVDEYGDEIDEFVEHMYDVKFTKDGYIKSFKMLVYYHNNGLDYIYNNKTIYEFDITYNRDYITEITIKASGENNGRKIAGNAVYNINWKDGYIDNVEVNTNTTDNYSSNSSYEYSYVTVEGNKYKQYTPASVYFIETFDTMLYPLFYLGYFGKASAILPTTIKINTIMNDGTHEFIEEYNSTFSYELENDATVACVYEKGKYYLSEDGDISEWDNNEIHKYSYDIKTETPKKTLKKGNRNVKRNWIFGKIK